MKTELQAVPLRGELITRRMGNVCRNQINNIISRGHVAIVDFSAVDLMTPSFADECFGVLVEQLGRERFREVVRLRAATAEVKHLVTVVLANRLDKSRPAVAP